MLKIKTKIIKHSKYKNKELITYVNVFPRFILAETNTHGTIARNAASSRAIPVKIMLEKIRNDPYIPSEFMSNRKGMDFDSTFTNERLHNLLFELCGRCCTVSQILSENDVHKGHANRYLEPFAWTTQIATGTKEAWNNYFHLRTPDNSPQIEFMELARKQYYALTQSKPDELQKDQWHIPFSDMIDLSKKPVEEMPDHSFSILVAVARCARVSYENHFGQINYVDDLRLANQLQKNGHWSPFEHIAQAVEGNGKGRHRGWFSLRQSFGNEFVSEFNPNFECHYEQDSDGFYH